MLTSITLLSNAEAGAVAETWANEVRGGEVSVRARQHYGFRVAGNRRCKRVVSGEGHGLESDA